jgi:hypothetical protein
MSMPPVAIPPWTASGLIPPVNFTLPASAERSPYTVSLVDLVSRFATSPERIAILDGFLRYRTRLHAAGLAEGFQWLDGSFVEQVEVREQRAPHDIDVVTFFRLPKECDQRELLANHHDVLSGAKAETTLRKRDYSVDAYLVSLSQPAELLVRQSTYWYSVWSHRRDATWKGYLQVDLAPHEDRHAADSLRHRADSGELA